ncbi:MFS transporter [Clostridium sp. Marseille-QA1073]
MKIEPLEDKDFLLLMLGKLVSLIGSQMQSFALSLYVLKITGSATKFASVLAIALIPQLIFGPIAGVIADWFDRKKIIVLLDMLNGIMIGIFAIIYKINGGLSLLHIYVIVILMSIISTLFNPAINTVIPTLVKKEELVDANGINSFIMNLGNFIAPLLAGFLLGFLICL